ncbi:MULTISPECIES: sigma-70 family RNA polymerase sigma factor [Prevotellaceae]|uniref:sigma-70 family RNA polymerase sigma factor n=1 Tax=Prevotellaceae TaxID=171552 RepID=UPI0003D2ADA3|nr:sigma-70 family RNA polymerase sigma factor [Prevotella phocaeensis]ETD17587.1 hypothetical protein HMPREF1199_01838 [Hoylesella oralis CC98A]
MKNDEITYITALKEGSYEAFAAIYDQYADRIYSFALVQTKNQTLSEDIVQETFLKLWDKHTQLDCCGNIQSLLFTIARHLIIDGFRRQVATVNFEEYLDLCDQLSVAPSPEEELYYNELTVRLQKTKARLSRRACEIYEMSREQRMPIKQIAESLNLSPQTVKNYLTSTLKIFRNELLRGRFVWFVFVFLFL